VSDQLYSDGSSHAEMRRRKDVVAQLGSPRPDSCSANEAQCAYQHGSPRPPADAQRVYESNDVIENHCSGSAAAQSLVTIGSPRPEGGASISSLSSLHAASSRTMLVPSAHMQKSKRKGRNTRVGGDVAGKKE
jgi:hypothetical protein